MRIFEIDFAPVVIPDDDPVFAVFAAKLFLQFLMNPVGEIRWRGDGPESVRGCDWCCCWGACDRRCGRALRKQACSQRGGANAEED